MQWILGQCVPPTEVASAWTHCQIQFPVSYQGSPWRHFVLEQLILNIRFQPLSACSKFTVAVALEHLLFRGRGKNTSGKLKSLDLALLVYYNSNQLLSKEWSIYKYFNIIY